MLNHEQTLIIETAIEQVKGVLYVLAEHRDLSSIPPECLSSCIEVALEKAQVIDSIVASL